VDDFHEGWVPATYLDPLYGTEDTAVQKLEPGEGKGAFTALVGGRLLHWLGGLSGKCSLGGNLMYMCTCP